MWGLENYILIIIPTRSDKKMDRLLSGVGDGCDSCLTPRGLWTDLETIEEGFPKNRTFENIRETWDSLAKDKDGEVIKRKADYETRKGQCHEPLTLRETLSFSMTHKVSLNICLFWDNECSSFPLDYLESML